MISCELCTAVGGAKKLVGEGGIGSRGAVKTPENGRTKRPWGKSSRGVFHSGRGRPPASRSDAR
jgi:hypothetical protein